jgi:hypothetical protein
MHQDLCHILSLPIPFFFLATNVRPGGADGAAGRGGGGGGEQRNLGLGVRGGAGAGEDAALAGVRGMAGAVPDRRRESSGQGEAARCAAARRPRAGWLAVRSAVVGGGGSAGDAEALAGGREGS